MKSRFSEHQIINILKLAVEIDTGISAHRVERILEQIAVWRGLPVSIRFDNGPE